MRTRASSVVGWIVGWVVQRMQVQHSSPGVISSSGEIETVGKVKQQSREVVDAVLQTV